MLQKIFNLNLKEINKYFLLKKWSTLFLNKHKYINSKGLLELKNLLELQHFTYLCNFSKIYMIGLGYKNFIIGDELFILIGDSNYLVFKIHPDLKIFCRKNQIYVLSSNLKRLHDFTSTLKSIKKINFYKGKGIIEFKNFKFTKLKVGKKQRFA
jgi:ABC-type uncharacterized transport system fused permease/ATPase subunit